MTTIVELDKVQFIIFNFKDEIKYNTDLDIKYIIFREKLLYNFTQKTNKKFTVKNDLFPVV